MDLHTERRSNLPLQKTRQKKDISELMGRDFFIDPRYHLAGAFSMYMTNIMQSLKHVNTLYSLDKNTAKPFLKPVASVILFPRGKRTNK